MKSSRNILCVLSAARVEILEAVLFLPSIDVALFWYHDDQQLDESWSSLCRYCYQRKGYKLENFSVLLAEHPSILEDYAYILFLDDDLVLGERVIEGFLSLVERYGLLLAHPSLSFCSIVDNKNFRYLKKLPCLDVEFQPYLEAQMLAVHVSVITALQEHLSMFVTGYGFSRACMQAVYTLYPESWRKKIGLIHRYSIYHPYKEESKTVRFLYRDMQAQRDTIDTYLVSMLRDFPLEIDSRGFPVLTSESGALYRVPVAKSVVSSLRWMLGLIEKFKIAYYLEVVRKSQGSCSILYFIMNYWQWRLHYYLHADQTSLPDLPYTAIDALDSLVGEKGGLSVLEVGGSSSRAFFQARSARVSSICFEQACIETPSMDNHRCDTTSTVAYSSIDTWFDELMDTNSELYSKLKIAHGYNYDILILHMIVSAKDIQKLSLLLAEDATVVVMHSDELEKELSAHGSLKACYRGPGPHAHVSLFKSVLFLKNMKEASP